MRRLLWVEDEPQTIRELVHELRHEGFEVDMVSDPEAALERLADPGAHYDALLTDIRMPLGERHPPRLPDLISQEMAGVAMIRALEVHIPVVVLSGITALAVWPKVKKELEELHATVLEKPVDFDVLLQTIKDVVAV